MKPSEMARLVAVCAAEGCEAGHPRRDGVTTCPSCGQGLLFTYEGLLGEHGLDARAGRRLDRIFDRHRIKSDAFWRALVKFQRASRLSASLYPKLIDLFVEGRRLFGSKGARRWA